MNRFPAKVKGSRLKRGGTVTEKPMTHPHPIAAWASPPGPRPNSPPEQVLVGTGPLPQAAWHLRGRNSPTLCQPAHRSLTISFLELFIRMWSCSLVTMMPSVSSASFTMNLQGERKPLRPSNQPFLPWASEK